MKETERLLWNFASGVCVYSDSSKRGYSQLQEAIAELAAFVATREQMLQKCLADTVADATAAVELRDKRIAELEAAVREMILSLPGGQFCDPQQVADMLRAIAERHGVAVE